MSILVLGGAGYIGSHAVDQLISKGYAVVVVDNLLTGHPSAVHEQATFYEGDIRDKAFLRSVFEKESIEGVLHFAANSLVGESVEKPLMYFNNNVIFGDDYDTPDGTCIRDYVYIEDLIAAHILALEYLKNGGESDVFNLGSNNGYSVKEMLDAAREVTGQEIPATIAPRRAGDPSTLIASSEKAKRVLGWQPEVTEVKDIIATAWQWHVKHPQGYNE
ncbi:UDP-glucose 4-epimerase [Enterococcus faecalis]|uniref:NAD-dependent epimerase/dehydratase family protein n=1 Tax=Enterococcus faecalis TaxID=1351 RepID=UPI00070D0464|nr:GDP-mannose 4,6-dehydratase [Enterococcus faecalis]KXF72073.1 hypothetical protein AQ486_01935 [Enterococcus faecalis]